MNGNYWGPPIARMIKKRVCLLLILIIVSFFFSRALLRVVKEQCSLHSAKLFIVKFVEICKSDDKLRLKPYFAPEIRQRIPDDPIAANQILNADLPHGFKQATLKNIEQFNDEKFQAVFDLDDRIFFIIHFRKIGDGYGVNYSEKIKHK